MSSYGSSLAGGVRKRTQNRHPQGKASFPCFGKHGGRFPEEPLFIREARSILRGDSRGKDHWLGKQNPVGHLQRGNARGPVGSGNTSQQRQAGRRAISIQSVQGSGPGGGRFDCRVRGQIRGALSFLRSAPNVSVPPDTATEQAADVGGDRRIRPLSTGASDRAGARSRRP